MPDSNPLYELIGGYYPGDPIPRRPQPGRGDFPEKYYMNPQSFIDDYLYEVGKEFDKLTPNKLIKERAIKDVERALRASVKGKTSTYDPMRALELGDEEDVAGLQFKVDLNPKSWIEDPADMAKKTAKGWLKDFVEWSDVDSYVEREHLWRPLLSGAVEETPRAARAIWGEHIEEGVRPTGFEPFQLRNLDVTTTKKIRMIDEDGNKRDTYVQEKIFDNTADDFQAFNSHARSIATRNLYFRRLSNNAVQAVSHELENLKVAGLIDPADLKEVESFQHRARILKLSNDLMSKAGDKSTYRYGHEDDVERTISKLRDSDWKSQVKQRIQDKGGTSIREVPAGLPAGLRGLSNDLAMFSFGRYEGKDGKSAQESIQSSFREMMTDHTKTIRDALSEAEEHFRSKGAAAFNEFQRDTSPLRKTLTRLEKLQDRKITGALSARNLKGEIDTIMELQTMTGVIRGGLDRMSRKILESHMINGSIRDVIFKNNNVVGSKNILNVMDEALFFYRREEAYDLFDKLEEDGLMGVAADYMWNLIRRRLDGYTPAAYINEAMQRMHYFGLIYDDDYDTGKGFFNTLINNSKIFENRVSIDIEIGGKMKNFKFVGEKGLKDMTQIYKRTLLKGQPAFLDDVQFLHGINAAIKDGGRLKDFLSKHNVFLELEMEKGLIKHTAENIKNLKSMFAGMIKEDESRGVISVFQNRAGLLQKFSEWAGKKRNEFLKKYGKILTPIAYTRNVLSRKGAQALVRGLRKSVLVQKIAGSKVIKALSKALTKALGAVFSAGTEGIGALVWPAIEKAIQYVLNKTIDFAGKVVTALRKGDLSIISSFVEAGAKAIFKVVSYIVACMTIPFFFVAIMAVVMLSAITPIDPTRASDVRSDSITDFTTYGPTTPCPPGECPTAASVDCFNLVGSWPSEAQSVIENAARYLASHGGNFVNDLCAAYDGDLEVVWAGSAVPCGLASSAFNQIQFGTGQCYAYSSSNQYTFNWLFAHEAAHMYHYANRSYVDGAIEQAIAQDGGRTLPTYRGDPDIECSFSMHTDKPGDGQMEDFAEAISNYIMYHRGCPETAAYNTYSALVSGLGFSAHYNLASNIYGN